MIRMGNQVIISPHDCKMIVEVKGNALGDDLLDFHKKAGAVKELDERQNPCVAYSAIRYSSKGKPFSSV